MKQLDSSQLKVVILVDKEIPTDHSFIQGVLENEMTKIGCNMNFVGYASVLPISKNPKVQFLTVPPTSGNFFMKKVHKLRFFTAKITESGPFDVLYTRNDPVFLIIGWWLKRQGTVTIHFHQISHLHAFSKSDRSLLYRIKSFGDLSLRRIFLKYTDKILLISDQMRSFLGQEWPMFKEKYAVYPLGVAVADFDNIVPYADRQFDVVYIGTLAKSRRIDVLIDAVKIHNSKFEPVTLHVWGASHDPKDDAELKLYARKNEVEKHVIFHGKIGRKEVLENLKNTKIGLSAIPSEGILNQISPTKLMEYLAAACCVIATNGIPDQEKIINEAYGFDKLINFNADEIANAIHDLNTNLLYAQKISSKGREYIFEKRSYLEMAVRLKSQMLELIKVG